MATMAPLAPSGGTRGGTIILQVDGHEIARVVDERLAVRESPSRSAAGPVLKPGGQPTGR